MTNYIMICHFENRDCEAQFLHAFKKSYPDNHMEETMNIQYHVFRARKLPAVQDELYSIIQNLKVNQSDYVALYYHRDGEDDVIKKTMILGSGNLVETQTNKLSDNLHEGNLNSLLSYDFSAAS